MFSKSVFVFAFLAVAKLAVATPPACMLSAIMTQDDPSKVSDICKNTKMSGYISSACGDETQQAMSAYSAVCKQAGVQVASSASASASDSASSTATGKSTATHSGKSSAVTTSVKPTTSVVVFTSASYDSACSCTKTAAITSTEVSGPTAMVTSGTATGTGSVPQSTGAAGRIELGAYAAVAGVVAGAFALL